MPFESDLEREKQNSLDTDYKLAGAKLMPPLEARGKKLVQQVADNLDKVKPNDEKILTDERLRIKQATRDVLFERQIIGMIDTFNSNILKVRDDYYKYTIDRLVKVWEGAVNPLYLKFAGVKVKFTKKEMKTLERVLFGTDVSEVIRKLRDRTIARFRSIVLDSYRSSKAKGVSHKSEYKKELKGAMNAMLTSMNNINQFPSLFNNLIKRFRITFCRYRHS